jgi:glycine/D-amino acid oxidase-like deaminating enzyme
MQEMPQMTKTPDFTKVMQDMMAAFPVDASSFQNAFKTQAAMGEKLSKVALEAAEKSTEISAKWAKDAIGKLSDVSRAKSDPADYTKAATDFASAAGKDFSEDATAAVKKATADVTSVAKKAAAAAK